MKTKSLLEPLEARIAPATVFVVDGNNHLLRFESAIPGTIDADLEITGIGQDEAVQGMDSRPATGEIYLLTVDPMNAGRIYTIDPVTAIASPVGSTPFTSNLTENSVYGVDFNPAADRLRIVNNAGQSFRVNPDTGGLEGQDAALNDPMSLADHVTSVAYDRNFSGSTATTLYGIDFNFDTLVKIGGTDGDPSPDAGAVSSVGVLGSVFGQSTGFDIANDGVAYLGAKNNNATKLYTVDLATGTATLVGAIGGTSQNLTALTVYQPVATVGPTGKTATYTDVDGDRVTVSVNKGKLTAGDFRLVSAGGFGRAQLVELDLNADDAGLQNANVTITAKKLSAFGDGRVDVGTIKTDYDLTNLSVKGDLGQLIAGDADKNTAGLKKLTAASFGVNAQATVLDQNPFSSITGGLGSLNFTGDLKGYFSVAGSIGSARIGGDARGALGAEGSLGTVVIAGSIDGRDGLGLVGGSKIANLKVAGSLIGGSAAGTGNITGGESIGSITIGKSVIGGIGAGTGAINAFGKIGTVKIGGDLAGGTGVNSPLLSSAYRVSGGIVGREIGAVTIGGSVTSAEITTSLSGLIAAQSKIGSITVKGSIIGNSTTQVLIVASGLDQDFQTTGFAIGKVAVGGRVQDANIMAGFFTDTSTDGILDGFYGVQPINGDASIGSVTVGRDWVGSNLVAGAISMSWSPNKSFGDANDSLQPGGNAAIIATIANVQIKGRVLGTAPIGDHFGFVAEQIFKLSIAGNKLPLTSGTDPSLLLAPLTNDVRIHEL